jgi:hypothetical protein
MDRKAGQENAQRKDSGIIVFGSAYGFIAGVSCCSGNCGTAVLSAG